MTVVGTNADVPLRPLQGPFGRSTEITKDIEESTQLTRNRLVRAASLAQAEQRAYIDSRGDLMQQHLDAKSTR
jgi:hypothetical protein